MKLSDLGLNAPQRLRDLIRDIRSAKTAAEEREVAQREGAAIRDSFRSEDKVWRCRNVAKLLYLHLLGYPAHYGQLECLKLIASHNFTDKRIGYLGAAMLLDERQNMLLMITNSLKNDLSHPSQFIVGLALSVLGAICSDQMGRDLAGDVERYIRCLNPYLKKKAIICACRIVAKLPESVDLFVPYIPNALAEKNHAILCATTVLVRQIMKQSPEHIHLFKKLIPNFVRILKTLLMTNFNPEFDVCSISDPFLQCNVLKVLKVLGKDDLESSEAMNDILAQIITSTDGVHNAGNAVLYDAVLTTMGIRSESGLRVLAINILGRFLLNSDKNVKYVALGVMLEVVNADRQAVKRHSSMILECLDDFDTSLKRRSMELCFAIVDHSNIVQMTNELLQFLENCEKSLRGDCASELFICIEKYAPNKTWLIDQSLLIFGLAGNDVRDDMVSMIIGTISSSADERIQKYACDELLKLCLGEKSVIEEKQPFYEVSCWCFGEYGADDAISEIVDVLEAVLSGQSSSKTKGFAINALMKLSVRSSAVNRINRLIEVHRRSCSLELQTRSVEYSQIVKSHDSLRSDVYASMPAFESKLSNMILGENQGSAEADELDLLGDSMAPKSLLLMFDESKVLHDEPATKGEILGYEDGEIRIDFDYDYNPNSCVLNLTLRLTNLSANTLDNCSVQVAVPKSQTLTVHPADTCSLPTLNSKLTQKLTVLNPQKEKIRLRIRFIHGSSNKQIKQMTISNFPDQCWM